MLHWFAGQKLADGSSDPDATGYIEPPETPAPVFAVRAFKHAIFGTPQTNQPKTRRHSNTENGRPKNVEPKPVRPNMNRPKSTNDAHTLAKEEPQTLEEPLGSPTKGILLTPGAAAARKKNVTFGENVVDNEEKRPLRSGLPEDCPGKYPSPWNNSSDDPKKRDESPDKGRGRSKLTEAFEQVREDSRKRKSRSDRLSKSPCEDNEGPEADHAEPRSQDGKYWKREYDIYRTNTQREVKKLITKQKAAKSFAQMKDDQCTELADQLRQEQKRVQVLDAKTSELASHIRDLQDKLHASHDAAKKHQEDIARLKRQLGRTDVPILDRRDSAMAGPTDIRGPELGTSHERTKSLEQRPKPQLIEPDQPSIHGDELKEDPVQRPSEPYTCSAISQNTRPDFRSLRARAKSKPEDVQLKPNDDIWAQLDSSSNPVISQTVGRPRSANSGLAVTSGTEATPLKALDMNTLSREPSHRRAGSPQSMDVECKSTPDLDRANSKHSSHGEDAPPDPPPHSLSHTILPSEIALAEKLGRPLHSTLRKEAEVKHVDTFKQTPASSPFQYDAKPLPWPPKPTDSKTGSGHEADTAITTNAKENISPISRMQPLASELSTKPSAVRSSMNVATAGKRSVPVTGKDGTQLTQDRIEAARARIAARGRVTS